LRKLGKKLRDGKGYKTEKALPPPQRAERGGFNQKNLDGRRSNAYTGESGNGKQPSAKGA